MFRGINVKNPLAIAPESIPSSPLKCTHYWVSLGCKVSLFVLRSYNYSIEYRSTTAHVDADSMPRLPLRLCGCHVSGNVNYYFFENDGMSYVSSEMTAKATAADFST